MDDYDDRAEYLENIGLHPGWNRGLVKCQICQDHWHRAEYETCYSCRPPWLMFKRREFSDDQKFDIMERDNFACAACGGRDEYLQVDHIMPCALGGESDVWNGQVLCAGCNYKKAANWKNTQWPEKRNSLIHFYLTFGWAWLSYEERDLLVTEALNKRELIGYHPFSGLATTSWIESGERKIVIVQSTPRVHFSGDRLLLTEQDGPLPPYINIVDGQIEGRRVLDHGNEFLWHTHVTGKKVEPPDWAIEMADQCPPR